MRQSSEALTLYSRIFLLAASSSRLLSPPGRSGPIAPPLAAGLFLPITSSSNLFLFSSGVSSHVESGPSDRPPAAGALAPLPVLNLRARNFVGSTREVQSPDAGGASIQSSRWAGCGVDEEMGAVGAMGRGADLDCANRVISFNSCAVELSRTSTH